ARSARVASPLAGRVLLKGNMIPHRGWLKNRSAQLDGPEWNPRRTGSINTVTQSLQGVWARLQHGAHVPKCGGCAKQRARIDDVAAVENAGARAGAGIVGQQFHTLANILRYEERSQRSSGGPR